MLFYLCRPRRASPASTSAGCRLHYIAAHKHCRCDSLNFSHEIISIVDSDGCESGRVGVEAEGPIKREAAGGRRDRPEQCQTMKYDFWL